MTEIDALLRRDAATFRDTAPSAPDLQAVLGQMRSTPSPRRSARPWLAAGVLVAATAVAVLVAVFLIADRTGSAPVLAPPTPPPSVTVDGTTVPYGGPVPWGGAIADPDDPRVVYVDADSDRAVRFCGVPTMRTFVNGDSDRVLVLVAGYETPLPPGTTCAGAGHTPSRTRVVLDTPLDGRALVDVSDGREHRVLDPAAFPTLDPPPGFVPAPLSWDGRNPDVLNRGWYGPDDTPFEPGLGLEVVAHAGRDVELDAPNGSVVRRAVPIGASLGTVWHDEDMYSDILTVRWTVAGGRTATLTLSSPLDAPSSDVDGVIGLARTAVVP